MCLLTHVGCFHRPTYATPKVLEKAGLKVSDIDVFEFHEAFAVSNWQENYICDPTTFELSDAKIWRTVVQCFAHRNVNLVPVLQK